MSEARALALKGTRETRTYAVSGVEVRSDSDAMTLTGYASTFDQPYSMGWYEERVSNGAFSKTLSENADVRLLINHDGLPLARTKSGTLELREDTSGLSVRATLDPNDPDVQTILPKMKRGDLDEMSFGFRTIREAWNDDYSQRTLQELSLQGGDVSVVTYPANPSTSVALRKLGESSIAAVTLMSGIAKDLRAGKVISADNMDRLNQIVDALASVEEDIDAAQDALAAVFDSAGSGSSDSSTTPDSTPTTDDETSARALATFKARATALRLSAHRTA